MASIAFDTLQFARRLKAVGVPEQQAETQAELMGEAFGFYVDDLVTRDYLDARLSEQDARMDARFNEQNMRFDQRFTDIDTRFTKIRRQVTGYNKSHISRLFSQEVQPSIACIRIVAESMALDIDELLSAIREGRIDVKTDAGRARCNHS